MPSRPKKDTPMVKEWVITQTSVVTDERMQQPNDHEHDPCHHR